MVNEDIVTALKNGLAKGESLEQAKQIMINSGYNLKDVEEASSFVGGISNDLQPRPDELLVMPSDKKFLKKQDKKFQEKKPDIPTPSPKQPSITSEQPLLQGPDSLENPIIKKKGFKKELILFITLLILIGILAITIFFRKSIVNLFTG